MYRKNILGDYYRVANLWLEERGSPNSVIASVLIIVKNRKPQRHRIV